MSRLITVCLSVLISSCAIFDGAKSIIETSHDVGVARGRAEVLRELQENKKKLDELKQYLVMTLAKDLTSEEKYGKKQLKAIVPHLAGITLLLNQRGNLLDELKNASAISSGSVNE